MEQAVNKGTDMMETVNHVIRVRCALTERQYRRYMRFHVLGDRRSVGAHLFLSLLIVAFGLMNFFTKSPILGWIFVTLGVYFLVSRYLRFYISVNRIIDQYGLGATPKFFYELAFGEDGFEVKNDREQARYGMDRICRACFLEQDRIAYLYLTKANAFLLPYEGFTEGRPEDLKALVREACPEAALKEFSN